MKIRIFDIEAKGFLPDVDEVFCAVFSDVDEKEIVKFRPHEMKEMMEYMDSCDVIIGHNILSYDLPVLKHVLGYEYKGKKVDTLIMSRLLNPKRLLPFNAIDKKAGPHSLYAWGVRLGVDKPEHEDWEKFSEDMLHRCTEDVRINVRVYKELLKEAKGGNWREAFLLSFKLFENLHKQEQYGWKVDKKYMLGLIKHLDERIERIDRKISPNLPLILEVEESKVKGEYNYIKKPFLKSGQYSKPVVEYCRNVGYDVSERPIVGCFSRISFRRVNLNSNAETKDYLLNLGWEPKEWNTNDEGERTSPKMSKDDPFYGIDGKLGKLVARRVQCRQRKSIIEGLVNVIRPDGCIPSIVNNLADTARATHRNIVNIPKVGSFFGQHMRRMFSCRDGMVLVGVDSDACQIRMLAGRMNDPEYTEVILNGKKENGTDMHTVNMKAAGLPDRDMAKTFFYGFLFGAGDAKIGKIVKGTSERGRQLKEQFLAGLPALGALLERLTKEWRATAKKRFNAKWNKMEYYDGSITGLDGRPIKVPFEHQILVYLLQSDEAILMQAAYNKTHKDLEKAGYIYGKDYGFVCWYHVFFVAINRDIY